MRAALALAVALTAACHSKPAPETVAMVGLVLESELVGSDLYAGLARAYPTETLFTNLAGEQEHHPDAVVRRARSMGVEDPAGAEPTRRRAARVAALLTRGQASLQAALDVALELEEESLLTLRAARTVAPHGPALIASHLADDTCAHLVALAALRAERFGKWAPARLTGDEREAILGGDAKRCRAAFGG